MIARFLPPGFNRSETRENIAAVLGMTADEVQEDVELLEKLYPYLVGRRAGTFGRADRRRIFRAGFVLDQSGEFLIVRDLRGDPVGGLLFTIVVNGEKHPALLERMADVGALERAMRALSEEHA